MRKRVWAALILVAVGPAAAEAGPARAAQRRAVAARVAPKPARPVQTGKAVVRKTVRPDSTGAPAAKKTAAPQEPLRRWQQARRHEQRGFQLYENRAWSEALQQFRLSLKLEPQNSHLLVVMGDIHAAQRALPQAVRAYEAALRLSPRDTRIHERLGITYERMDKPHLAASVYRNVIWIDARDASAHQHLGWALERQGKRAEAILAYQQALRLQPDNLIARARLNRLRPIEPQFARRAARGRPQG